MVLYTSINPSWYKHSQEVLLSIGGLVGDSVMCLIASGKTVSEIAEELGVSVPTVSAFCARILEKMSMKINT